MVRGSRWDIFILKERKMSKNVTIVQNADNTLSVTVTGPKASNVSQDWLRRLMRNIENNRPGPVAQEELEVIATIVDVLIPHTEADRKGRVAKMTEEERAEVCIDYNLRKLMAEMGKLARSSGTFSSVSQVREAGKPFWAALKSVEDLGRRYRRLEDIMPELAEDLKLLDDACIVATTVFISFAQNYFDCGKVEAVKTYILSNKATGLLKIGRTSDVKARISALECGAGARLELLLVIEEDVENKLHKHFKSLRMQGEWFADDGRIAKFIHEYAQAQQEGRDLDIANFL